MTLRISGATALGTGFRHALLFTGGEDRKQFLACHPMTPFPLLDGKGQLAPMSYDTMGIVRRMSTRTECDNQFDLYGDNAYIYVFFRKPIPPVAFLAIEASFKWEEDDDGVHNMLASWRDTDGYHKRRIYPDGTIKEYRFPF